MKECADDNRMSFSVAEDGPNGDMALGHPFTSSYNDLHFPGKWACMAFIYLYKSHACAHRVYNAKLNWAWKDIKMSSYEKYVYLYDKHIEQEHKQLLLHLFYLFYLSCCLHMCNVAEKKRCSLLHYEFNCI